MALITWSRRMDYPLLSRRLANNLRVSPLLMDAMQAERMQQNRMGSILAYRYVCQNRPHPVLYSGIQVCIGTLPQYVAAVQEYLARNGTGSLQTLSGEMRSGELSHLLPAVLSSRMWIKQQNAATEHLLERWMEPMTAWA